LAGAARMAECNARDEHIRRAVVVMELFHNAVTIPLRDRLDRLNNRLRECGRGSNSCIGLQYYPNPDPGPDALYYIPQTECPP
jgi:hypothetical protein